MLTDDEPMAVQRGVVESYSKLYGRLGIHEASFPGNVYVIDAITKALAPALPQRVPGGHFGTHSGVRFYGRRPDGSFFDTHDSGHGGWGACATHDGAGPFRSPSAA